MAKFSLLYNDVRNLGDGEDVTPEMIDAILDDILELQSAMDTLHDKYQDLLAVCRRALETLDEAV